MKPPRMRRRAEERRSYTGSWDIQLEIDELMEPM